MKMYRNTSKDITLKELFPQKGVFELKPGEAKPLPKDVASAWLDSLRQKVIIEEVEDVVEEQPKDENILPTVDELDELKRKDLLFVAKEVGAEITATMKNEEIREKIKEKMDKMLGV